MILFCSHNFIMIRKDRKKGRKFQKFVFYFFSYDFCTIKCSSLWMCTLIDTLFWFFHNFLSKHSLMNSIIHCRYIAHK